MFALLEKGAITIAPREIDGILDPPDEVYYEHGYSLVVFSPIPRDGIYDAEWEQGENTITQVFVKREETDDIDEAEAYDIIFGGAE